MKPLSLATALAACLVGGVASAELIERDWLAPGDGLLTYDSRTRLEWLDISQTQLENFPPGVLVEDRYQAVVAETLNSGRFTGFAVATAVQALGLAESAGVDTEIPTFEVNEAGVADLLSLIGSSYSGPYVVRMYGLLDNAALENTPSASRYLFAASRDTNLEPTRDAYVRVYPGSRLREPFPHGDYAGLGVMLVRNAIPEPTTATLAAACLSLSLLRVRPTR